MIDAVIFDMDGLMFDTESTFFVGFKQVCLEHGIPVTDDIIYSMIGCDSRMIEQYEKQFPGISQAMKEFQERRLEIFFEMYPEPGSGNMEGLEELIAYLNEAGIVYAIASSSHPKDIRRLVQHADCEIQPKEIVSSKEHGIASKPAPDIFLEAAKRLGVNPENCLVLEDSKNGVMATRRAGMLSIYIPDKVHPDRQMYPYIHTTCDNLAQVISFIERKNG